jgi:hypothetical protein
MDMFYLVSWIVNQQTYTTLRHSSSKQIIPDMVTQCHLSHLSHLNHSSEIKHGMLENPPFIEDLPSYKPPLNF